MFDSIKRSWQLYKVCWTVLLHDKELLMFPLLSSISLGLTIAVIFASGLLGRLSPAPDQQFGLIPADYLIIGGFYFVNYFIIVYFNAAIIGAARIRFQGGNPTLSDGFRVANSNLSGIAGWAFVSAIVSLVFYALDKMARSQMSEGRGGAAIVLMILSSLAQFAWSIITYLVIPVLVVEGIGPIEAIKRSAGLVKRTWGEQLISRFGFDLMVLILGVAIVGLAILIAVVIPGTAGLVLAVAWAVIGIGLLLLTTAALRAIYIAALYDYANTGVVPELFPKELVSESWQPRGMAHQGSGF